MAENPQVYLGDCRDVLPKLAAESVQMCCTSPPYWGLRDYGTAQWEGGEVGCDHSTPRSRGDDIRPGDKQGTSAGSRPNTQQKCKCGARRIDAQLGLEATPEEYITNMVGVFREVWRVLKPDGTLFLNLGDSYFSSSQREASYDTSGKESASSQAHGYLSENLCDACRAADQSRKSRNGSRRDSKQSVSPSEPTHGHKELANGRAPTSHLSDLENHNGDANQHLWQTGALFAEQPRDVQESNRSGSYPQSPGACLQTSNLDAVFPLSELSSGQCVQEFCDRSGEFSQKQNYTEDNVSLSEERARRNRYIGAYCSKCGIEIQPQCSIRPFSHLLKPKDLCMMPARLAMALQADGWYLRSDIIWHKPNPMPESVKDRCCKSHEYIFMLTKSSRYYFDSDAIAEPATSEDLLSVQSESSESLFLQEQSAVRRIERQVSRMYDDRQKDLRSEIQSNGQSESTHSIECRSSLPELQRQQRQPLRNRRSVWTIPTQPYAEAHFATFPEEIPKLCILAGSKPGDTVLDPFAGSGTTGKVALELGRRAVLIELNEKYIELARDRTFVTPGMF